MNKSEKFEDSIQRLEEIVRQMEAGNVPLEQTIQLFEEGTALVRTCGKLLDEAELKVVKLAKDEHNMPKEQVMSSDTEQ